MPTLVPIQGRAGVKITELELTNNPNIPKSTTKLKVTVALTTTERPMGRLERLFTPLSISR